MKIAGYRCMECGHNVDEYFNDTDIPPRHPNKEKFPDTEFEDCPECHCSLEIFNFKNNPHRVNIFDRGGF